jgi:hypothetical protein
MKKELWILIAAAATISLIVGLYRHVIGNRAADGDTAVYRLYLKVNSDFANSVDLDTTRADKATADAAAQSRDDWGNSSVRIKLQTVSMDFDEAFESIRAENLGIDNSDSKLADALGSADADLGNAAKMIQAER